MIPSIPSFTRPPSQRWLIEAPTQTPFSESRPESLVQTTFPLAILKASQPQCVQIQRYNLPPFSTAPSNQFLFCFFPISTQQFPLLSCLQQNPTDHPQQCSLPFLVCLDHHQVLSILPYGHLFKPPTLSVSSDNHLTSRIIWKGNCKVFCLLSASLLPVFSKLLPNLQLKYYFGKTILITLLLP